MGVNAGRKTSIAVSKGTRKLSCRMDSEVSDAFRLFDKDKDGKITRKEIEELVKASDNSGSVDLTNFMNLWQQFKASVNEEGDDSEEEIKKCFKDYDKDGDGYITKDEMMNVITKMGFVSNK